jgi:subtilisin family serine protease
MIPLPSPAPRRFFAGFSTTWIAACFIALLFAGCGRTPLAPHGERAAPPAAAAKQWTRYVPDIVLQVGPGVAIAEVAASYGAELRGEIAEIRVGLFAAPADSAGQTFLDALRGDQRVTFAEANLPLQTAEGRQSSMAFSEALRDWDDVADQAAIGRIWAHHAHAHARGRGVLVAILDTGVDHDHPALASRLALPGIEPGVTTAPGDERAQSLDTNGDGHVDGALGHGTHVAGIVAAVAPEARILPVRVLDSDGVGDLFGVARGLVLAVERGAAVANLSLGTDAPSQVLAAAVAYARERGTVVVAPAGNEGGGRVDHPAALPEAIAVAGVDTQDRRASFSNAGEEVDLSAPATGILSAFPGGGYARWSGTSMAAPFVAGSAALLLEHAGAPGPAAAERVECALRDGATSYDLTGGAEWQGLGRGRLCVLSSLALLLRDGAFTAAPAP